MRLLATAVVAVPLFVCASSSFAAMVTRLQGNVEVDTGRGFHRISGAVDVAAGSTVMAGPRGRGEIIYPDGCRVQVEPGAVVVVASDSPCKGGYLVGLAAAAAFGLGIYEAATLHHAGPASP
jgi:hypothetical protein